MLLEGTAGSSWAVIRLPKNEVWSFSAVPDKASETKS